MNLFHLEWDYAISFLEILKASKISIVSFQAAKAAVFVDDQVVSSFWEKVFDDGKGSLVTAQVHFLRLQA